MNMFVSVATAVAVPVEAEAGKIRGDNHYAANVRLLELERQIAEAEAAAIRAGAIFSKSEEVMFAWKRHNPKPQHREVTIREVRWDGSEVVYGTESYRSYMKAVDEANADLAAAVAEHCEVLKFWNERHCIARTNCRYAEREAEFNRLINESDALRMEAAAIPASTVEDLRCKARMLSEADLNCVPDGLAESIITDLQAWPTEATA